MCDGCLNEQQSCADTCNVDSEDHKSFMIKQVQALKRCIVYPLSFLLLRLHLGEGAQKTSDPYMCLCCVDCFICDIQQNAQCFCPVSAKGLRVGCPMLLHLS